MVTVKNIGRVFVFALLLLSMSSVLAGDPIKGRELYEKHCGGCHGLAGVPTMPALPNFTMGQGLMKSDREILAFVKKGKVVMPGFDGVLTDAEILDVIAHLRTFF
jgi:mono/diheme cytochrome c family protein